LPSSSWSTAATAADSKKDERIIKSVTRDYQKNGIITDVAFHSNLSVNAIVIVALMDNTMLLISSTLWDVRRVIVYPDFYIRQCQFLFLPHMDMNVGNVLLTLTSNDDLMLTCLNGSTDLNSRMLIDMTNLNSFALSANGRLLVNVHESGELLMHNLQQHLNDLMLTKGSRVMNGIRRNKRNEGGIPLVNDVNDAKAQHKVNKEKLSEIQMKVNPFLIIFSREFHHLPH
jgi:hypothetical protein